MRSLLSDDRHEDEERKKASVRSRSGCTKRSLYVVPRSFDERERERERENLVCKRFTGNKFEF